jgi:hypothetical protein
MVLNYLIIGFIFTFIIELFLNIKEVQKHPKMSEILKQGKWNTYSRIVCILIWPLAILIFLNSFFKSFFK